MRTMLAFVLVAGILSCNRVYYGQPSGSPCMSDADCSTVECVGVRLADGTVGLRCALEDGAPCEPGFDLCPRADICDPVQKICVRGCSRDSECPSIAPSCHNGVCSAPGRCPAAG